MNKEIEVKVQIKEDLFYFVKEWVDTKSKHIREEKHVEYYLNKPATNLDKFTGLTNDQKKYLRENGAINVSKDLTDEEFEAEKKLVEEELISRIDEFLDKIFSPILKPIII
ncbi:hypothetical protein ACFLYH_01380 [Candidatus Dependentiae bacterium]